MHKMRRTQLLYFCVRLLVYDLKIRQIDYTDRQTDRQQAGRQADRQIDRLTVNWPTPQIDVHREDKIIVSKAIEFNITTHCSLQNYYSEVESTPL